MSNFLIDTNVISEFANLTADENVARWFQRADPESLFASVVTLGEIRLGVENLPAGKRRVALEAWLEIGLPGWFASNLLPVTKAIADRWGRITIRAKRNGVTLATIDGLIAATALEHDLILVTRNVKDFANLDLALLNPWQARATRI